MIIKDLSMSFGLQDIFNDVSLQIKDNEKIGIIGVNGAGKSTFFKIIMGKLKPDKGKVILKNGTRIGFLPQVISDEIPSMDITVFDFLLDGRPIKKLENELNQLYEQSALEKDSKKVDYLMKQIGKIQQKLEYYEVYNAENILLKIISGMNIKKARMMHDKLVSNEMNQDLIIKLNGYGVGTSVTHIKYSMDTL